MCRSGCISSNFPGHKPFQSLSFASLAQLLLGRLLTDNTCSLSLGEAGSSGPYMPLCSQNILAVVTSRKHGDLTVWALAFPSGHREGSLPKQPEEASQRCLWDPTREALTPLQCPSHITFSVAFVTCHISHIHLEVVPFTGLQDTHFSLIPQSCASSAES